MKHACGKIVVAFAIHFLGASRIANQHNSDTQVVCNCNVYFTDLTVPTEFN